MGTCTDMKEQMTLLNRQLQETTLRNNQRDEEAFVLRRDIRLLKMQLASCSSTASAVTGFLKVLALTREVTTLQRRIKLATNSTETETRVLHNEMQAKMNDLLAKKQQMDKQHSNSSLTLQKQLNAKLRELRLQGDVSSAMLEVISVHSKIAVAQRLISAHIDKSRTNYIDYQMQMKQKSELLTKKILQLNREEKNKELTKEILILQRELEDQTTSTSQAATLLPLLQAKEREYAKAQADIKELQRLLQEKRKECSGYEERHSYLKTELEQKIAELNRTGDSKASLILNIINLHDELKTLKDLISTTKDPDRISDLQRQLEAKGDELNYKTEDMERLVVNYNTILSIIELQQEIWHLQKKATNGTTSNRERELQTRVDDLISEINQGDENIKLMLKIMTLQSQVEQLQKQILDLNVVKTSKIPQLENDLSTKEEELQKYIDELRKTNQSNSQLILTITDLNNRLRKLQEENQSKGQSASVTVTKLKEQLKIKEEEHLRDQVKIRALQNELNQTAAQCSSFGQKIKDLQIDLDEKMKKLQSESDSVTSLALQVSTLTLQQEELNRQLQNTDSKDKIQELQKQLEEKNNELAKKTEELKARSAQPQRFLHIISIQTEIERLVNVAANNTDYSKIRAIQDHLNDLIEGIEDENGENTKLVFKILTLQEEIARLKKQEESQSEAQLKKIKDLESELEDLRNQITWKTLLLVSSDLNFSNLSAQIMELHQKIKPLEDEISNLKDEHAENLAELEARQSLTKRQLQDSELRLKDADTKNFQLMMDIIDLREQLTKAQKKASKAAGKIMNELEQQLQTHQKENRKLENSNRDLKQEVKELKMCCNNQNTLCEDLQRQLQLSQEDVNLLEQQLQNRDSRLKQLRHESEEQTRQSNRLQHEYQKLQNEKNKLEETLQGLQNQSIDVEDKKIYTRRITLDPNTANPRIVLSADNTEMSTVEEIQNVPDHPGRFDVVLATLGKTGFSSKRNYWEVSVTENSCYHLGMASESAPRRGSVKFSPSNGFWTIVRNKQGQYRAIDKRPVILPVQSQPLTLGILLDYNKGQISFYDANARSHIYSFQRQRFTDKVHPFINFCVEDTERRAPIVLITPGSTDWIQ
nr:PREDICTED: putative leucine-rich repeat-containing protein DDB_G0290503 [Paralichthys olivaceus]